MTNPITYGSVIHLKNQLNNGGYLEVRGWVADKQIISQWYDSYIRAIVLTHPKPNRLLGSGSWEILSAVGTPIGEPVRWGDKVYLRNLYDDAGYLDTFEWVTSLAPFKRFQDMEIGVFTARKPQRHGGTSGTWTLESPEGKQGAVTEQDKLYLKNNYNDWTLYLYAYGNVAEHELFKEYPDARHFVFTARKPLEDTARTWIVSRNTDITSMYYLRCDDNGAWIDFGTMTNNSLVQQAITSVECTSTDEGNTLSGSIAYQDGAIAATMTWDEQIRGYVIKHTDQYDPINERQPNGAWKFGVRGAQKITALMLRSYDDGTSLSGSVTYANETELDIRAMRANPLLCETADQPYLYDFFQQRFVAGSHSEIAFGTWRDQH